MTESFRGESVHKVDAKGRVSIPASFRRVLELGDPDWTDGLAPTAVIVYGGKSQNYLEAYTKEAANEMSAKIKRLPLGSKARTVSEKLFLTNSITISIDDTGRFVLPQKLRDKVDIGAEAYFAGSGDTFKIWTADAYVDSNDDVDAWVEAQGDDFHPLSLLEAAEPARAE